jgi:hypothetical protein
MRIPRLRLISSAALLCVTHVTTASLAADVQIDEHTLCRTALHAFDAKDTAGIQDFLDFIQNVFKALDAQYTDVRARSVSVTMASAIVRGFCQQHPASTIYDEAVRAYRSMHASMFPSGSEPAKVPPPSEGKPRFRQQ